MPRGLVHPPVVHAISPDSSHAARSALGAFGGLPLAFGLLGALVAYGTLRAAETAIFDPFAYHAGVGLTAVLSVVTRWAVCRLERRPRWRRLRWSLVPMAGAIVGMSVQAILLRQPASGLWATDGLSKAKPISWIMAGAPLGAIPALVVLALLFVSVRLGGAVLSLDARERAIVPVAGVSLVLSAGSIRSATAVDAPVLALIGMLSAATLCEILLRDRDRERWVARLFDGGDDYAVVLLEAMPFTPSLPLLLGGVPAEAAIVRRDDEAGYRSPSRVPIAMTASSEQVALRPLRARRAQIVAFFVIAALGAASTACF